MTERHQALLAELAQIGLEAARELRRQVAETASDAAALHRISRTVRQSAALEG